MIARLHSVAFFGIEAVSVEVEADVVPHGFAAEAGIATSKDPTTIRLVSIQVEPSRT